MMQDTGYKTQDTTPLSPPLSRGELKGGIVHRASCIVHHDKKGVTLIELVITMVLMAIVALVVANAMSTAIKGSLMTDNRKEALDQARVAMERMTREIRNLRNSASVGTGSSTSQFCFMNTDGLVVSFRYPGPSANTIARQDGLAVLGDCPGSAGNTLATNITSSFAFGYVRGDNGVVESTFSAANTKRIRITIPCDISNEIVTLQSDVWPRNL